MQSKPRTVFLHSLLLAWLIISLLLFVAISRVNYVPLVAAPSWKGLGEALARISPLFYLLDVFGALLGVLLFSLACLSFGLGLLWKQIQSHSSKMAAGVTAFLVGEILFSLIFLTLISLYRLTPILVAITVSLGFLVGFPALRTFIAQLSPDVNLSGFERSERLILILGVFGLILGLLLSSTRLGYDATAEYFSHAKIMAVSHSPIFFYPKDYFVVSSFHPGILFTAVIQLFGDQAARLLPWVNGMAMLLIGLDLGQELGLSPRARLWFLTLMATSTAFVDLLGDGKIELISTAPILGAVYWLVRSLEQPTKVTYALAGFLSAFAIISRPYNIFLVSLFIALFFISQTFLHYRAGRFALKPFLQSMVGIMAPLLALGAFHLFQNWIWLKSPIAPLAYARALDSSDWQWQLDPRNLMLYRLFYPFILTFLNSPQTLGNLSPLFLGFLPFLLVKSARKNLRFSAPLKLLTLLSTLTLLIWITVYFTVLEIRYVLFLWIVLFLPIAQILESVTQSGALWIRPLVMLLVISFLIIMGARTLILAVTAYLPPNNISSADCSDTNLCNFMETINQRAAPGDRVFVLHAYRYYLRPDLFACSSRVEEYAILEPFARQNSSEFWVELYRRGYRFIIFEQHLSERRYNFGKLPDPDSAPDWLQIKNLYSSLKAEQLIYQLEAVAPPISVEISCRKDSKGLWQLVPFGASGG